MNKNICKIFAMMILSIVIALPAMAADEYKKSGATVVVNLNSPSFINGGTYLDRNGNEHDYNKYYGYIKLDNYDQGYNIVKVTRTSNGYKLTLAPWQIPYLQTATATCSGNTLKIRSSEVEEWVCGTYTKVGSSSKAKKTTGKKTQKRRK